MIGAPAPPAARPGDKAERLARAYDADVWPIYSGRFAALALRALERRPAARIFEIGCATGLLTVEMAGLFGGGRISAFDEEPAFVAQARARFEADPRLAGRATAAVAGPETLPAGDEEADVVVSNLAVAEHADPAAAAREAARVLAPGGQAVITVPLRGTWTEFLDMYREVLGEQGKRESMAALDRYVASLPVGDTAARWLEQAGLTRVEIAVERWEILFRSAREFFFAPLIELGPLSRWKQIAGKGDEMQDIFYFTKEAIDSYFEGMAFPLTVVGAAVSGRKPAR